MLCFKEGEVNIHFIGFLFPSCISFPWLFGYLKANGNHLRVLLIASYSILVNIRKLLKVKAKSQVIVEAESMGQIIMVLLYAKAFRSASILAVLSLFRFTCIQ